MPVIKGSERYNFQILCMNRKILMIRPKMWLAKDVNYRELRWFTTWKQRDQLVDFHLPFEISEILQQKSGPFGYGFIQFLDTSVEAEVCVDGVHHFLKVIAKGLISEYQLKFNSAKGLISEIYWNMLAVPPTTSYKVVLCFFLLYCHFV
ncbi:hypothetical protein CsatA_023002 [Cannabis sativa]